MDVTSFLSSPPPQSLPASSPPSFGNSVSTDSKEKQQAGEALAYISVMVGNSFDILSLKVLSR